MKKSELISKYEHRLTLRNYSENTLKAYLNGLTIFLEYVRLNQIQEITPKQLEVFFHHCKKELGYSYSMMKQLLASVSFLYEEVLNEEIDFDFNIKMKKPSRIPVVLSVQEVERFLWHSHPFGEFLYECKTQSNFYAHLFGRLAHWRTS